MFRCFLCATLMALVACGGPDDRGSQQPSWRTAGVETPAPTPAPKVEVLVLPESDVVSSHYNQAGEQRATEGPLASRIHAEIARAAEVLGKAAPLPDNRLDHALRQVAEVAPLGEALDFEIVAFSMQRQGIIEPSPHLVIIEGDVDNPESIMEQLGTQIMEIIASGRYRRVGIGIARRGEVGMVLLAFQDSFIRTKPFPRSLPRGGAASLEGNMQSEFQEPHAFHTTSSGKVVELGVARFGSDSFRVRFSCGSEVGKQQLELTASDHSGSTVLANFPVWCGQSPPSRFEKTIEEPIPPPKTREEAESQMFALINRDRREHGLPELAWDGRASLVARAHSDEMLQTGEVAHVSPTTGSASDRVAAAGIRTAVVLENVARAYAVSEAQLGLMNSPGHRANLLSPDVSHVGVGITLGEKVAGRRELLVTQIFILRQGRVDLARVRSQVHQIINSHRAVQDSPVLTPVAQRFASAIASGVSTDEAAKVANAELNDKAREFRRVSTLVTTLALVKSFDPAGSLGPETMKHVGIGVAQGNHPVMGEGALFLVLLLAEK